MYSSSRWKSQASGRKNGRIRGAASWDRDFGGVRVPPGGVGGNSQRDRSWSVLVRRRPKLRRH
jgi:hypothetical protein